MKKLDTKFHGMILKNKDLSRVPPDRWMIFLVTDNAFPPTLNFYLEECKRQGAKPEQLEAVEAMIQRVAEWRIANAELCKTPDVDPGELRTS